MSSGTSIISMQMSTRSIIYLIVIILQSFNIIQGNVILPIANQPSSSQDVGNYPVLNATAYQWLSSSGNGNNELKIIEENAKMTSPTSESISLLSYQNPWESSYSPLEASTNTEEASASVINNADQSADINGFESINTKLTPQLDINGIQNIVSKLLSNVSLNSNVRNDSNDRGNIILLVHHAVINLSNTTNVAPSNLGLAENDGTNSVISDSISLSGNSAKSDDNGLHLSTTIFPNNDTPNSNQASGILTESYLAAKGSHSADDTVTENHINHITHTNAFGVMESIPISSETTSSTSTLENDPVSITDTAPTTLLNQISDSVADNNNLPWNSELSSTFIDSLSDAITNAIETSPSLVNNLQLNHRVKRNSPTFDPIFIGDSGNTNDIQETRNPNVQDSKSSPMVDSDIIGEIIRNATLLALSRLNSTSAVENSLLPVLGKTDKSSVLSSEEEDVSPIHNTELVESLTQFIKLLTAATLASVIQPLDYD